ncbi:hypothetical protein [Specibacter cremeus]|uniref:hypothetical protein n=1 Tax=Specibacter cremeus TaxID=1629051 RepID=UPI000F76DBE0|nr:hypothetical protein [Specibacter cremeus]
MINTPLPADPVHRRLLLRGLTVVGLAGTALVHLDQLPDTLHQTPLLGAMFAVLVAGATAAAVAMALLDSDLVWLAVLLMAAGTIGGYIITRSMATPIDDQDLGNWFEPLGLVSLFVEAALVALCVGALRKPARAKARIDEFAGSAGGALQ